MSTSYNPGDDVAVTVQTPRGPREVVATVMGVTAHSLVVVGLEDDRNQPREIRIDENVRPVRRRDA